MVENGNAANLAVLVTVTDVDEIDPVITSGSASPSVVENTTPQWIMLLPTSSDDQSQVSTSYLFRLPG